MLTFARLDYQMILPFSYDSDPLWTILIYTRVYSPFLLLQEFWTWFYRITPSHSHSINVCTEGL